MYHRVKPQVVDLVYLDFIINLCITMTLANATMRGVVWQGNPYQMAVVDLPRPTLQVETDAIVRITTSAICGTDLHVYHGVYGSTNAPWGMGHEAVGIIEQIGNRVHGFSPGDYVIIPDAVNNNSVDPVDSEVLSFGLGDDYGRDMGGTQGKSLLQHCSLCPSSRY